MTDEDRRRIHRLKSWPAGFGDALTGRKRFEVRRDDRDPPYAPGDAVELREFVPPSDTGDDERPSGYTGRRAMFYVGYLVRGAPLPPGWCAFDLVSSEDIARILYVLEPTVRGGR